MEILFGRSPYPVLVSFAVCGMLAGLLYDLLKIKRKLLGAPALVVFADDVFFCFCTAVAVVFDAYAFNDGNLKWYEAPAMLAGWLLYRRTLSRLLIKTADWLIGLVGGLVKRVTVPLCRLLKKSEKALAGRVRYACAVRRVSLCRIG